MGLTPEEREEARRRAREELEAEHRRRLAALEARRRRSRSRAEERRERERAVEIARIREEEARRFYEEKGYRPYVDHTGRQVWLSPEEYEYRTRLRRRKRRHREFVLAPERPGLRIVLFYAAVVVLAIAAGILIAR